jgi:hypothetical protein
MVKAKGPVEVALPAPADLERICKGIAMLDAMISSDWDSRYYSFDASWNKRAKHRMASMRNGSGDDWFIVFTPAGVFVKSFWHEYKRASVDDIFAGMPKPLAQHKKEAAFMIDDGITFGGFHDGTGWTLRGNAAPLVEELAILSGDPAAYRTYAAAYFEEKVPLAAIEHVLAGKKLDAKLVARVTKEQTLADLKSELADIGY